MLANGDLAYISRYALGRDYHKTIRNRLQKLATKIETEIERSPYAGHFAYRAFSDSAPVMEVELARQSGLAWRGKHTLSLPGKAHGILAKSTRPCPCRRTRRLTNIAATASAASLPARHKPSSPRTKLMPDGVFHT